MNHKFSTETNTTGPATISATFMLLLCLTLPLFAAASDAAAEAAPPERVVVAKVNGKPIYEDQLKPKVQASIHKYSRFGVQAISSEQKKQLEMAALDEVISTELFLQASQQLDIPDIEQRLEEELTEEKSKPTFDPNRVSEEVMKEHVRQRIYLMEYLERNDLREPEVSEADIKAFYDQNKEGFAATEDKAHVRHILIKVKEDAATEEKAQARRQLLELRGQLLEGKDFALLAKEYSQDANAANGGDLGTIEPGYMPPAFDAAAFSLEPGSVSDIVETPFGFHVLEVLARIQKGTIPTYEELRDFLEKYLKEETRQRKMSAHAQMLKQQAEIEILLPEEQ